MLQQNQEGEPRVRKSKYIDEVIPEAIDHSNFDMTQAEVAQVLRVKREGINQIEKRALKKFKALLREKGVKKEDLL